MVLAALSSGTPLLAENVRVNIPANAFSLEGQPPVLVDDVTGGRRFRNTQNFAKIVLRATLPMPAASAAEPKLQRLVIRFRAGDGGPTLRRVEVRNGGNVAFGADTNIGGDFLTREVTNEGRANTWDWGQIPLRVGAQSVLRLVIQFPGGFDSQVRTEFVLASVTTEYPRKGLSPSDVVSGVARRQGLESLSPAGTAAPTPTLPPLERVRRRHLA